MKYSIALHGGAGTITKGSMTKEKETEYKKALKEALITGQKLLMANSTALEAVAATVESLENCPLFNAGKGSVFNAEGKHEMDAAIMCGKTLEAGAVAGLFGIKNPILAALAVMKKSDHVILSGKGASTFANLQGLETAEDDYFFTTFRYEQLAAAQKNNVILLDHTEKKFGTVGAVALDSFGNIAAATSTGGMTNKQFNRIGDSPIIGAGTYANNKTAAISCTGHGEYFIRGVVAYDVSCIMEYMHLSLSDACEKVILDKQVKLGGEGGLVAVDSIGNVAMVFNSEGMYRAAANSEGLFEIAIYRD